LVDEDKLNFWWEEILTDFSETAKISSLKVSGVIRIVSIHSIQLLIILFKETLMCRYNSIYY